MLRSALLVIGHVLTVDAIGLVQKMVGGIQKHRLLLQTLPSLFPSFALFSSTVIMCGIAAKVRRQEIPLRHYPEIVIWEISFFFDAILHVEE